MTLDLRLPKLSLPVVYGIHLRYRFLPVVFSGSTIHSGGPLPETKHMCSWSKAGFFEKLDISVQNWSFVRSSCTPGTGTVRCVPLARCFFTFIRPYFGFTTITGDSVSAGVVTGLPTQLVACSLCSSVSTSRDIFIIRLGSISLLGIPTDTKCSGTILSNMCNVSKMTLWIDVIRINIFTARFCTIPGKNSNQFVSHFHDKGDYSLNSNHLFLLQFLIPGIRDT